MRFDWAKNKIKETQLFGYSKEVLVLKRRRKKRESVLFFLLSQIIYAFYFYVSVVAVAVEMKGFNW